MINILQLGSLMCRVPWLPAWLSQDFSFCLANAELLLFITIESPSKKQTWWWPVLPFGSSCTENWPHILHLYTVWMDITHGCIPRKLCCWDIISLVVFFSLMCLDFFTINWNIKMAVRIYVYVLHTVLPLKRQEPLWLLVVVNNFLTPHVPSWKKVAH